MWEEEYAFMVLEKYPIITQHFFNQIITSSSSFTTLAKAKVVYYKNK